MPVILKDILTKYDFISYLKGRYLMGTALFTSFFFPIPPTSRRPLDCGYTVVRLF